MQQQQLDYYLLSGEYSIFRESEPMDPLATSGLQLEKGNLEGTTITILAGAGPY